MQIFQSKLSHFQKKPPIVKTILVLIILFFGLFNLSAQKESNIKLKIEAGFLWDWVEGRTYLSGPFLNVEPKLKTSKNTFIGLRIGAAQNTQRILSSDPAQFYIDNFFDNGNGNGTFSFAPTFDYYLSTKKSRPYLGVGLGYYFLTTSKKVFAVGNSSDVLEVSVNNKIGFLVRGGLNLYKVKIGKLDLSKIIINIEFNYIPIANIETPNGQIIGTINTSNIALAFGYTIGNRKSSK